MRKIFLSSIAGLGLTLAGCNSTSDNAVLAAFADGLANVSCTSTTAAGSTIATNIINIAAPTAQAAQDDALAASAATIAAELCPAFKGLGNVVIQATIASSTPTGTPTVTVPAPVATAPADAMKRGVVLSAKGEVTSTNPFMFVVPMASST